MEHILYIGALASCLKILFLPMYHSTDFEVHRNWLAVTHNLSHHKWYYENTSEWTLDYPPLFAWFEFALSQVAWYFDPGMLVLENLNYSTEKTILFQRLSVIVSDIVLMFATYRCCKTLKQMGYKDLGCTTLAILIICNAGLLLVDHIHFQYNGFLTGIFFMSLCYILEGRVLWGSLWFAILLNFKHIYLYVAPAYGIFLLRTYCMSPQMTGFRALSSFSPSRLMKLATIVIAMFTLSFAPFKDHLSQVLTRLFPFKRGLTHAYWAPNFWALYNFVDKLLSVMAVKLKIFAPTELASSFSKGLVEQAQHAVLLSPSPLVTLLLTFLFMMPCLVNIWIRPKGSSLHMMGNQFLRSVVYISLTSFMFGWHVHEKAILMAVLPQIILAVSGSRTDAEIFLFLQVVGHYSLFPLLFQAYELITRLCIVLLYAILAFGLIKNLRQRNLHESKSWRLPLLGFFESIYIYGLCVCEIYCSILHRFMPFAEKLKFLPLMIMSVYCALGVSWAWLKLGLAILYDDLGYSKDGDEACRGRHKAKNS